MQQLARQFELQLVVLLGSYNTEEFKAGESDIDIAFLSEKSLTTDEYLTLINDLSGHFRYSKIDLIDLRKASGLLKYEIATKGRLLYELKEGDFIKYGLYCLRYYYDTAKFRQGRKEYFNEQLEGLSHERN